jgi:small subunit ribosomal protein S17e
MGRIKTAQIKRLTLDLVEKYRKDFKTDFESNKKLVAARTDMRSKKIRNTVAGYVTRIIRANKD